MKLAKPTAKWLSKQYLHGLAACSSVSTRRCSRRCSCDSRKHNRKQIVRAAKDKYVPVLDILISEGVIRVPRPVFEL